MFFCTCFLGHGSIRANLIFFPTDQSPNPNLPLLNAIPPTDVLLSLTFPGEMSDACEVLIALYDSLKAMAQPSLQSLPDEVFGLKVHENVHCEACGKDTNQIEYTAHFHTTAAASLRLLSVDSEPDETSLGKLLRNIEQQHRKSCDTDKGEGLGVYMQ